MRQSLGQRAESNAMSRKKRVAHSAPGKTQTSLQPRCSRITVAISAAELRSSSPMPQTLRTLLLICLAWFMPLHALDATTGQWHSAEAAELSSAADLLVRCLAPARFLTEPGTCFANVNGLGASRAN
jgi:hypothetical protein